MLWIPSLLLLVLVAVCTTLPYVFLSQLDGSTDFIIKLFGSQDSVYVQIVLYSAARLCSFIFIPDLQAVLLTVRGFTRTAAVVLAGEAVGVIAQAFLVRCGLAVFEIRILATYVNHLIPFIRHCVL